MRTHYGPFRHRYRPFRPFGEEPMQPTEQTKRWELSIGLPLILLAIALLVPPGGLLGLGKK